MQVRYLPIAMVALFIAGVLSGSSYADVNPASIMGIWLLDEGTGDVAKDSSGNGNDGKLFGAKWVDGMFGSALEFDGTSHVEIPASPTTDDYMNGFTYLLRVKPTGTPSKPHIRLIERDHHCPTIQIGPADFHGSTRSGGQIANTAFRGGSWEMNEWSFVALTYDGTDLKLYVDDEMVNEMEVGEQDFRKEAADGAIWLAAWKATGWDFTGVIDDVAIFNVALDEDDIGKIRINGLDKVLMFAISDVAKLTTAWGQVKAE